MRNKKRFRVDGQTYWMRELTIDDIFALYYTFDSIDVETVGGLFSNIFESLPLLESITTCPWKVLVGLGSLELKNIYGLFLKLNSTFFSGRLKKGEDPQKELKTKDFIDNIFFLYCDLTESGHTDVLRYGYSFFLKAVSNHERIKCSKIADLATSSRMAYHSEKKDWKKYIRGLVGK